MTIGGKRRSKMSKRHGGLFDNTRARLSDVFNKVSSKVSNKYSDYQARKAASDSVASQQKRQHALEDLDSSASSLGYSCTPNAALGGKRRKSCGSKRSRRSKSRRSSTKRRRH